MKSILVAIPTFVMQKVKIFSKFWMVAILDFKMAAMNKPTFAALIKLNLV